MLALVVHHLEPHQGRGPPAARQPMALVALQRRDMVGGREEGADHAGLGLAVGLGEHRPEHFYRLDQLVDRHRRRGIDQVLQRAVVVPGDVGMGEQHVDQGRRHVDVRDLVRLDRRQDGAGIGRAHEDVGAAIRQQREGADARRMGHRRHHQMDRRRADRHAGPEDRVHGLDVAVGDLHALGPAGRAARAREERHAVGIVGQVGRRRPLAAPASRRTTAGRGRRSRGSWDRPRGCAPARPRSSNGRTGIRRRCCRGCRGSPPAHCAH